MLARKRIAGAARLVTYRVPFYRRGVHHEASGRRVVHATVEPLPLTPSDPPRRVIKSSNMTYSICGPSDRHSINHPTVVCVHGCPGSTYDWRWLGPGLEGHTTLLRFDLPGHGDTPESVTNGDASPEAAANAVWEAVDAVLSQDGGPAAPRVVLLGHSLGTEVAAIMAELRPHQTAAVCLLAPVGLRPHRGAPLLPVLALARLCSYTLLRPLLSPAVRLLYTRGLGFPERTRTDEFFWCQQRIASRDFALFTAAVTQMWRVHRIPTMLAWALDDPLIEPLISHELSEAVGEDSGPRLVFARGGHNINKSHARVIARTLLSWMRELHLGGLK